jgi:hypothetical protein
LESSDAYRAFYSLLNKDTTEKEMDAKERYLYWKLRRKTQRATMFTLLLVPKLFFLHTWLSAFGLDKGVSLADIIGTEVKMKKMQRRYFDNKPKVGARFITLNGGTVHYTTR